MYKDRKFSNFCQFILLCSLNFNDSITPVHQLHHHFLYLYLGSPKVTICTVTNSYISQMLLSAQWQTLTSAKHYYLHSDTLTSPKCYYLPSDKLLHLPNVTICTLTNSYISPKLLSAQWQTLDYIPSKVTICTVTNSYISQKLLFAQWQTLSLTSPKRYYLHSDKLLVLHLPKVTICMVTNSYISQKLLSAQWQTLTSPICYYLHSYISQKLLFAQWQTLACDKLHGVGGEGFIAGHGGSVVCALVQVAQPDGFDLRVQNHHHQLGHLWVLVHVGDLAGGEVRWTKGVWEAILGRVPGKHHPVVTRLQKVKDERFGCSDVFISSSIAAVQGLGQAYNMQGSWN